MTSLSEYVTKVGTTNALGVLVWQSIPDLRIRPDALKALAQKHGLGDGPKPGNAADAFRRATSPQTRRGENRLTRFLVRPVVNNGEELVRHVVVERVNTAGETLSHESLHEFRFNVDKAVLTDRPIGQAASPGEKDESDKLVAECLQLYRDYTSKFTGDELTRFVMGRLKKLSRVTVHPHGHVYFLPRTAAADAAALGEFVRALSPYAVDKDARPTYWVVPVPDSVEQREMVTAGFKSTMLSDLSDVAGKVADMLSGKKSNWTERLLDSQVREIAEAREKTKLYKQIVGVHVAEVDAAMDLLDQQTEELARRLTAMAG